MSRFVTYLALDRLAPVTAKDTIAAFNALASQGAMRIESASPVNSAPGEAFIVTANGAPVTVKFIDKPLPADAWGEAAARNIVWRDTADTMRKTRAHVIVALLKEASDHRTALNGAAAVTLVAGALALRLLVAATVFTEAHAIVPRGEIEKMAAGFAQGAVPDMLWTTLSFMSGPQAADGRPTTAALTTGLRPFIGREIEFEPAPLKPDEIAQRLIGLRQYLIVNGPIIKDGETVGLTETEKFRVRYAASGLRVGVPVMLMSLETEDPAAHGFHDGHFRRATYRPVSNAGPSAASAVQPRRPFGRRVH